MCVCLKQHTSCYTLGFSDQHYLSFLLELHKSYRMSRYLSTMSATWHTPLLSLSFTVTTCIVLHGNQMINQWTHVPSFASIIEHCCYVAETKQCSLFVLVMAGQGFLTLQHICFVVSQQTLKRTTKKPRKQSYFDFKGNNFFLHHKFEKKCNKKSTSTCKNFNRYTNTW